MNHLSDLLSRHHAICDDLFAAAEEAANMGKWSECEARMAAFSAAISEHLAAEEEFVFPAFEQATGMSAGPTVVMRSEHTQMRALIASLLEAAQARQSDDFFGASETLLVFMAQHNRKEEGILYPMCDQRIPAPAELAARVAPRLEH